ncbi:hypothetical protein [Streptomyces sp. NPDC005799]|uniref:hypothetical protein n=1 Tax=Streptomyces sp. NPDC005799 TaxID=3154678 RepID=UPI0033EF5D71
MNAATRNDPAGLRRHNAEGLELALCYGMVWGQGIAAATSAMLAAVTGRFDEAEARYAEADGLLRRVGAHHATGPRTLGLITIRLAQGRADDIEPVVRDLHAEIGTRSPSPTPWSWPDWDGSRRRRRCPSCRARSRTTSTG